NHGTANQVYASWCATIDTAAVYWHGCIIRKGTSSSDPNYYYLADSSKAAGHPKYGGYWMVAGKTRHFYPNSDLIVDWYPASDIYTGSCYTVTAGLSGWGASFSYSWQVCPQ